MGDSETGLKLGSTNPHIPLVAIDLETTGLSFRIDHILEIGTATETLHATSVLVNEGYNVSPIVQRLTGITSKMLTQSGVSQLSALLGLVGELFKHRDPVCLVGYNIHQFDGAFLIHALMAHGILDVLNVVSIVDLLPAIRRIKTQEKLSNAKLGTVYQHIFGRVIASAHRASADAVATMEIMQSDWLRLRCPRVRTDPNTCWTLTRLVDSYRERLCRLGGFRMSSTGSSTCSMCLKTVSPYFEHMAAGHAGCVSRSTYKPKASRPGIPIAPKPTRELPVFRS